MCVLARTLHSFLEPLGQRLPLQLGFRLRSRDWVGFPSGSPGLRTRLPMQETETRFKFLGWEDPLEREMATHCSVLACRIPWTEEPGGLQSRELQRVGHA